MSQLTEIRWHARAGQGAVTAAKLVADTAMLQGNFIQQCLSMVLSVRVHPEGLHPRVERAH